jgi:hypothetical protein
MATKKQKLSETELHFANKKEEVPAHLDLAYFEKLRKLVDKFSKDVRAHGVSQNANLGVEVFFKFQ